MTETTPASSAWPFARMVGCPLDPPPQYADFQREPTLPTVELWDKKRVWLATRYDDVREVFRDKRFSADTSTEGFPSPTETAAATKKGQRSMARMDPPRHDEQRRMVSRYFTIKETETFRPYVEALVDDLLDEMDWGSSPTDLVAALAQPVPAHVTCRLLDLPHRDADFFLDRVNTWMDMSIPAAQAARAGTDILDYFRELIAAREASPGDDLVSRIVVERVLTGELTREELAHMLHLFLVGGYDTTVNMISLGFLTFMRNPNQRQALQDDPGLAIGATEELLRYLSVAHYTAFRLATEDIELGGRCIHAGEGIAAPLSAANRDPEMFPEPDTFDINRKEARRHLAFGSGVHQCLGQPIARLELQVVFAKLFTRFPRLTLAVPESELRFKDALIYGVEEVPVTW
ncbi:MAG TPA: cytochrome P450 [Mycobacterium sp.]